MEVRVTIIVYFFSSCVSEPSCDFASVVQRDNVSPQILHLKVFVKATAFAVGPTSEALSLASFTFLLALLAKKVEHYPLGHLTLTGSVGSGLSIGGSGSTGSG